MSVREIISSLIENSMAEIIYYDHEEHGYYYQPVLTKRDVPNYDPKHDTKLEPCLLFAGSGDYVGSTIDMANRRYIENEYPELIESGAIEYYNQGYGYTALIIFFLRPSVVRSGLIDDFESLPGYPLFNDELESEIQQELLEEAWEFWVKSDFESEIENLTGFEFMETDWQESLFWNILSNGSGSEYFPEGTSIHVDMGEVFNDSESLIKVIQEHAENLDTGEFKIEAKWKTVGHYLQLLSSYAYNGEHGYDVRQRVMGTLEGYEVGMIKESVLTEFGLIWRKEVKLFWEVRPINEVLKEIVKTGIKSVVMLPYPVKPDCKHDFQKHNSCVNCYNNAVCQVNDEDLCPDCYNKLMEYHPKCERCQQKNVNASLQLSLLPSLEDNSNLTHCQDCKNLLLTA